jgi:3,5-epimerase/4-reductase
MKFLVYGGNGWIGQKIIDILKNGNHTIIKSNYRLENINDIKEELSSVNPERVICCTGRTHGVFEDKVIPTIDYLEKPGKLNDNIRDNLFGPTMLALECQRQNIHLTYIGTGCIFTYSDEQKIFTESSLPNFFDSSYSIVKGYTDRIMNTLPNVLNVRIRMPISVDKSPRNFLVKLIKYSKICSVSNSMTILDELLPIMIRMCIDRDVGPINMTNPGVIEHKDILELYKKYIDDNHKYELISYNDQMKILSAGRSNNELSTDRLTTYDNSISNIKDGIEKIFIKWKINKV